MLSTRYALACLLESLLFVLLVTATTARPTVDFVTSRPSLEHAQRVHSESLLRSHAREPHDEPSGRRPSGLRERMMPGVTPILPAIRSTIKMNQLHFSKLGVVILSSSTDFAEAMRETTRKLETFYMDIAYKAQDEWSTMTAMNHLYVDDPEGKVRLEFYCVGDVIPWAFVKEMAERLYTTAAMGMANLFEVMYGDDAATIGVRITLNVIQNSSDDSSGAGYREGSVPSVGSRKTRRSAGAGDRSSRERG